MATPVAPVGKVSKNQRASGPKQDHQKAECANGHARVPVMVCAKGPRGRMYLLCQCDGYSPIAKG